MLKSRSLRLLTPLVIFSLLIGGCQYSFLNLEYRRGESAVEAEEYKKAVGFFRRVMKRSPNSDLGIEAAQRAAKISVYQTKDYKLAVTLYEHIVLYSKNETARREAQLAIAKIYFEKLANYKEALKAYNKLLSLPHTTEEESIFRMAAARSNFYLGDYFQSQIEVERL